MVDLKAFTVNRFRRFVEELGEPAYRADQLIQWIYAKGVTSFDEMTNLPAGLREQLGKRASIDAPEIDQIQTASDGTSKLAIRLRSGNRVESVLIPDPAEDGGAQRVTVCVSSQVGCAMGCMFCATGLMGFHQNLTPGEIYDQVRLAGNVAVKHFGRGISNIVFMGMGEPLLNYEAVLSAVDFLVHPLGMGMSPRRVTVSTVGLARRIRQLADNETKFRLAVSLHAPTDAQRSAIMPVNRAAQTDLRALREALRYYHLRLDRPVTYEYCLFKGMNDRMEDARQLVKIARWIPSKVNLLSYNPVEGLPFQRTSERQLNAFASVLAEAGIRVTVRKSRGRDIDAACGQLAGK